MTTPAHPRETSFTDLPAGQVNLYFIDVTNVWKKVGGTWLVYACRPFMKQEAPAK